KEADSTGRVEGIYARCILNDWDARSHRVKDLYMRTKELLQTGVLPGVYSFRSLYKERERAINLAYNYFVKYCWYEYGVEIGDAMRSRDWMSKELFKREPLYMSMRRIRDATNVLKYKKNMEELLNYYKDIAEHTPNPELKEEMLSLINSPLKEIVPRLKNSSSPPVGDILLDWARERTVGMSEKREKGR
ncbi:MAG: hypothetical protein ACP5KS_06420, partial [Candidatus Hydrogenedens sp.]